ncbi:MAG: hypothetical protein PHN84_15470 [Desulfuromonadaceae bacterium]|nr:hypothetical protein [Desulfuromonadaceae bacterium]
MSSSKQKKTRTEQAAEARRDLYYEKHRPNPTLLHHYQREAALLMIPETPPDIRQGEVMHVPDDNRDFPNEIINTLADPDTPAVDASVRRTDLLQRAGSLDTGIDAANTIDARNSLEKMLAHQMATCHVKAMNLIADSSNYARDLETRMFQLKQLAVATKLMDVYQKGMDTLCRTRNAGKQTIVVKQVHVTGGQNVIAENLSTGGFTERGEV